jgi:dephospho-CoA kinase
MIFRVALTGGIASGKSTVAARFAELGVVVIDADVLAREVVAPGSDGLADIQTHFGSGILTPDGHLDRAAMRALIFKNNALKQKLEAILHPRIGALLAQRSAASGGPYQVFEIPLYAETGGRIETDRVLVVDCDESVQIERLMTRDGESEAGARRILAAQATRTGRLAVADDVIINNGDRDALAQQVARLHALYSDLAR